MIFGLFMCKDAFPFLSQETHFLVLSILTGSSTSPSQKDYFLACQVYSPLCLALLVLSPKRAPSPEKEKSMMVHTSFKWPLGIVKGTPTLTATKNTHPNPIPIKNLKHAGTFFYEMNLSFDFVRRDMRKKREKKKKNPELPFH